MQRGRGTQFDPEVLDALLRVTQPRETPRVADPVRVGWQKLEPSMEIATDLRSREGALLLSADFVLTSDMIQRIGLYARREAPGLELQIKAASLAARRVA